MNIKEVVNRGVMFLNFFNPGWKEKIDIDNLNMGDPKLCILGQLYGDYCLNPLTHDQCFEYGFSTISDSDMLKLTKEWKSRFIQKFNLDIDDVKPGKYIVFGVNQQGFIEGDVIDVLEKEYIDGLETKNNVCNVIVHNNRLYLDPPIIVVPKKV